MQWVDICTRASYTIRMIVWHRPRAQDLAHAFELTDRSAVITFDSLSICKAVRGQAMLERESGAAIPLDLKGELFDKCERCLLDIEADDRPRIRKPRRAGAHTKMFSVWMTSEEHGKLEAIAKKTKVTNSERVRQLIVQEWEKQFTSVKIVEVNEDHLKDKIIELLEKQVESLKKQLERAERCLEGVEG